MDIAAAHFRQQRTRHVKTGDQSYAAVAYLMGGRSYTPACQSLARVWQPNFQAPSLSAQVVVGGERSASTPYPKNRITALARQSVDMQMLGRLGAVKFGMGYAPAACTVFAQQLGVQRLVVRSGENVAKQLHHLEAGHVVRSWKSVPVCRKAVERQEEVSQHGR